MYKHLNLTSVGVCHFGGTDCIVYLTIFELQAEWRMASSQDSSRKQGREQDGGRGR